MAAHDISKKWRSDDIKTDENVDFSSLLLSKRVLQGLNNSGFLKPSPIQLQAIPLGRCGLDLIVQAKSGTGKTCVFTVIALEGLLTDSKASQVLVLAPTREIAYQIKDVVTNIGSGIPNLKCGTFIGGLSLNDDKNNLKNCQIVIGTPGRIKHLIELNALKTTSIRLFILDEADKLLDDSFQKSINWIYKKLPSNKQMLALSATYPEALANLLKEYMRNPFYIRLNADQPTLLGIKQYYKTLNFHQLNHIVFLRKIDILLELLKEIHFAQCIIFSNSQVRAESLCQTLIKNGWPAAYISGAQDQTQRLSAMAQLKAFECRILVSTDLTSRGIDAENVNLIFNIDVPRDLETYLHRIGRAGRFGSQGLAISMVSKGKDLDSLIEIAEQGRLEIVSLPKNLPEDLWSFSSKSDDVILKELKSESKKSYPLEQVDANSTIVLPKSNTIKLNENDFEWLNDAVIDNEKSFHTIQEIFDDYNTFNSNFVKKHTTEELACEKDIVDEEIEACGKDNLLSYLKKSQENFWVAVAKNYNLIIPVESETLAEAKFSDEVNDENSATSDKLYSVNDELGVPICKVEEKKTNLSENDEISLGKKTLDKIEPVPGLVTNVTKSKLRMLKFYQSQQKPNLQSNDHDESQIAFNKMVGGETYFTTESEVSTTEDDSTSSKDQDSTSATDDSSSDNEDLEPSEDEESSENDSTTDNEETSSSDEKESSTSSEKENTSDNEILPLSDCEGSSSSPNEESKFLR